MVGWGYVLNVGRGYVINVGRGYVIQYHEWMNEWLSKVGIELLGQLKIVRIGRKLWKFEKIVKIG